MSKQKICIVTGSRAEYGLLYWLIKEIKANNKFDLQLIVTGMHLSSKFGMTYKKIERDFKYLQNHNTYKDKSNVVGVDIKYPRLKTFTLKNDSSKNFKNLICNLT